MNKINDTHHTRMGKYNRQPSVCNIPVPLTIGVRQGITRMAASEPELVSAQSMEEQAAITPGANPSIQLLKSLITVEPHPINGYIDVLGLSRACSASQPDSLRHSLPLHRHAGGWASCSSIHLQNKYMPEPHMPYDFVLESLGSARFGFYTFLGTSVASWYTPCS